LNARWQVPLSVLNARLFKISAQIDFWRKELPVKTTNNMGQLARLLYAALYADDGWFSASRNGGPGTTWQGHEKLARSGAWQHEELRRGAVEGIKHMYVNHVIVPSAEGATGRIDLIAIGLDGDPHKVEHQGH
jgi:hypothetical protein